ncbi:MAG TPA: Omp28-related outer membrane protein [Flavobacteriales bacterium]
MKTPLTLRQALSAFAFSIGILQAQAQNAYPANVSMPRYAKAGVNYTISAWCRNVSSTPYTNVSISWRLDGGTWNNMTATNIGGGGVTTNNYLPLTHPMSMNTTEGEHVLEVRINTPVDTDPSNNIVTIPFTALSNWADKVVLLETRTETWCPQCPPSNTVSNALMNEPDYAVVKFHMSDALDQCTECITYFAQHNLTYTPAGIVEMGEYGGYAISSNYNLWEPTLEAKAAGVSPVELTMTSSINAVTRVLTVTLNAEFNYAVTGPHRLNVYVAEDNVAGPQQNAPSNYQHNRVMRAMLGGAQGSTDVVPNAPVVGTTYSETYTWTVPAGYDLYDLQLVGVIEHRAGDFSNRYSLNAVKSPASPVGVEEIARINDRLLVYPNPFRNGLRVHLDDFTGRTNVELLTLDGRVALQRAVTLDAMGTSWIDVDGVPAGPYLLRITTPDAIAVKQVVRLD